MRRSVPPFPPVGPGSPQFPTFTGTMESYDSSNPSRPSPVSLDGAVPPAWMLRLLPGPVHPYQPGPGPLAVRRCPCLSRAGGGGRPPRFLENPCESVPRARDSGGSQRPRSHGRPDAVFRQAKEPRGNNLSNFMTGPKQWCNSILHETAPARLRSSAVQLWKSLSLPDTPSCLSPRGYGDRSLSSSSRSVE